MIYSAEVMKMLNGYITQKLVILGFILLGLGIDLGYWTISLSGVGIAIVACLDWEDDEEEDNE
jgi:hypothetical protein